MRQEVLKTQKDLLFKKSPRMQLTFQIGENPRQIVHGTIQEVKHFSLDRGKGFRKVNRPMQDSYFQENEFVSRNDYHRIYQLASHFLQTSSFNILIQSVKHDFERQGRSILESDYVAYFWLIQFFIEFQRTCFDQLYRAKKNHLKEDIFSIVDEISFDLVAVAFDMNTFRFIMKMAKTYKEDKLWSALHVAICTIKQILISLEYMIESHHIELTEFGMSMQNHIFHDGDCLVFLRQVLHDFKQQSRGFLVDVVLTVHVLLRSLEKYLRQKRHLFVRSKRRRKLNKDNTKTNMIEDENEAKEELERSQRSQDDTTHGSNDKEEDEREEEDDDNDIYQRLITDKEFCFETYEISFASEVILHNYCLLLRDFHSNDVYLNHCIAKMFHRIFVSCKLEAIFYKLSILTLFNKLMNYYGGEVRSQPNNCCELYQFAKFVCRKFFKRLTEYPLLFLEILFPKRHSDCYFIQFGENYRRQDSIMSTHHESPIDQFMTAAPASDSDGNDEQNKSMEVDVNQFKKIRTRWSRKHVDQLKVLYELYGNHPEAISKITQELGNRTSENIERQLIKMKLIPKPRNKRRITKLAVYESSESETTTHDHPSLDTSDMSERQAIREEIDALRKRIRKRKMKSVISSSSSTEELLFDQPCPSMISQNETVNIRSNSTGMKDDSNNILLEVSSFRVMLLFLASSSPSMASLLALFYQDHLLMDMMSGLMYLMIQ
jgi:ArsR family metal-binding transcriptional regulator